MSTDAMEQAFLDGTHPALSRDADAAAVLRSTSPTRSASPSHSDADDDDDESRFSAVDPDPPTGGDMPLRAPGGGRKGGSHNTGVKGVRADYREHLAAQDEARRGGDAGLARQAERKLVISLGDDEADRRGDEEEDDELTALRRRRLAEMQGSGERRAVVEARTFGHLREVGMEQYVQAVEDEAPDVAVVVHLYEPQLSLCALLNSHLAALARLYPSTKFLRAQASEVDFMSSDLDADTLPTVLVYRAGELETTWVRFDLECDGGELREGERGRRQVEEMLNGAGAISGAPRAPLPYSAVYNGGVRGRTASSDDEYE
ncbi:hypothetical protein Rhopal_004092-T1 [Rhodotorula paludigena]|uniref:Phosducin domain-containing protein n=1 Tax=Rhodotorula paludigena TaxID=86838 RepID=A0AAV5GNX5_9BASI|nr:hypothetical protein Rhopal_004092-T1 [Rhodotorula paludigena]